jgi:hypothetical protein
MFAVSKQDRPSELHVSIRYVGDYYNEFDTLFGRPRPARRGGVGQPNSTGGRTGGRQRGRRTGREEGGWGRA